ncbi:hypothetical protein F0P96_08715 [Hymenobacter busanensis]|uniref:Uncharacterized protein n=1 Tax=Hymenobacter busanensis TaxID=2607656 RepID=A0A7L4ZYH0_9BACT|nr:hypothetical protein [Hymenobacter busanensis]KAA9333057.1 hypothetical protein F0P96_08715 [Hymenobacter busanensis]QHJ08268.1 hypothetical protein GUY19_13610 [Hymenobacter busanensis]
MLRFFRSTLPTRLIGLVLLVLAIRLPLLWFSGVPLSWAELRGWVVGERLHAGALLYRDVYDHTAPLAAAAFGLLDALVGRSVWVYRLLAVVLLLTQSLRLSVVFNRYNVHPERGYLAALSYALVGSASTDLDILSPLLLGQTFVVFALSALLPTSREGYDNTRLFRAGFLLGVAALCYLPLAMLLLVGLFAVISFAANSFRSFLLLLCGFGFPYAVVATVFLYFNALPQFRQFHLEPMLAGAAAVDALPRALQLKLLILPAIVLVLSLTRTFTTSLGLVFQVKFQQLMLVWLVTAVLTGAILGGSAPGLLVLMLPPLAYFSLFLWQHTRRGWVVDVLFVVVLAGVLGVRHRAWLGLDSLLNFPLETRYAAQPDARYAAVQGQRVLVLGPSRGVYLQNRAVTAYVDWPLARRDFGHLNKYDAIFRLATQLPVPPPVLIDEVGLLPELRHKLPATFGRYQPTRTKQVYQLK